MTRFDTKPKAVFVATLLAALLAAPAFASAAQLAPVKLGMAGTFALLSKTGITNVYASTIKGDVGTSPITGAAIDVTCGEIAGGILYTLGGAVYGFQRPNPFPSWFGFHEVFHSLTILAFAAHFSGVFLATHALR